MELQRITLLLAMGAALWAGEPDAGAPPRPKSETEATVTVTAASASVEVAKTPNPVTVVTAETLQRLPFRTLSEVLQDIFPGQVAPMGGVGSQASLHLGGSRSADTVVLLDGLRISDASGLGLDLSQMDMSSVDRLEVISGPSSSLYGSDAHGGVVALCSPGSAPEGFSGSLAGLLGTRGRGQGSLAPAYGWKGGWVRASLRVEEEDQATQTDEPFRQSAVFVGMGQALGEDHLLTASYRNHWQGTPLPWGWDYNAWPAARTFDSSREATLRQEVTILSLRSQWRPDLLSEVSAGRVNYDRHYSDTGWQAHSQRDQASATLSFRPTGWGASLLLDGSEEHYWEANPDKKAVGRHLATALELSAEPLSWLRLVGSARQQWDRTDRQADGYNPAISRNEDQFTWKAGANVLLPQGFRVYASAGSSFNAPSLYQMGYNSGQGKALPGNEESRSVNLGASWASGPWQVVLEGNRIRYDQVVVWTGLYPNGYYANQKDVRVQGLELRGGYRAEAWGLEARLRNQEGRDLSLPAAQQLSSFSSRPFTAGGVNGRVSFGKWRMDARASYVGHRYAYSDDEGGMAPVKKSFTDLGASLQFRARRDLDLTLRAEHLLTAPISRSEWLAKEDLDRSNASLMPGYPAQPRAISLEARYRF